MKKIISIVILTMTFYTYSQDQLVNIPDKKFKKFILSKEYIDKNKDGEISYIEASSINNIFIKGGNIENLTGIEAFVNLKTFYCEDNNLKKLDVSSNKKLKYLHCKNNQLTELKLPNNLEFLYCENNQLTHLVLNKKLNKAVCSNNKLKILKLNELLKYLECNTNKLTSLELNENLRSLRCSNNQLTSIKLNNKLRTLNVNHNQFKNFTVNNSIDFLDISNNKLEELDLSAANHLNDLNCSANNLTKLDINSIPNSNNYMIIKCNNNNITFLDNSKSVRLLSYDKSKVTLKEASKPKPKDFYEYTFSPDLGYKFKHKNNLKLGVDLGWYKFDPSDNIKWGGSVNLNYLTNFHRNNILSAGLRLNTSIFETSINFSKNEIEPTFGVFYNGIRANVGYCIPTKNIEQFQHPHLTFGVSIASKKAFQNIGLLLLLGLYILLN